MFDLENLAPDEFSLIPDGWYDSFIEKAEFKASANGTEYLNITYRITGDRHNNRVVFDIMNICHEKEQVRNIALRGIKAILISSGATVLKFSSKENLVTALLKCRCQIKLGNKTDNFGPKNTVKGYAMLETNSVPIELHNSFDFSSQKSAANTADITTSDIPF